MAGTVAAATKRTLIGLLAADPGRPADTQVEYGFPGRTLERAVIYAGKISGDVQLASMAGPTGRVSRREDLMLDLHIAATTPGESDTAVVEDQVCEAAEFVAHFVAGNPTLDGSVDGLKLIRVAGIELDSDVEDESAVAVLTLKLAIMSHIR